MPSQAHASGRGPLFPHFICRVGALPTAQVESLRAPGCAQLLDALHDAETQLESRRETLSQALHAAIGAAEDPGARRSLVQLRRDLFNLRLPPARHRETARTALAPQTLRDTDAFRALLETRDATLAQLAGVFRRETEETRARFQSLVAQEPFQRGLLLSSGSLYQAQRRYLGDTRAEQGGERDKTERGLLRYFTRAAMKATPFSTFCAVLPGEVREGGGLALEGEFQTRSFIRLNKQLYGILVPPLQRRPAVRARLPVETNPTLTEEGGELAWLAVSRGRELFQRVDRTPVLELVASTAGRHGRLPLGELVRQLVEESGAPAEEAAAYVDRLLEIGFLRFRMGVREQDVDWDLPLRALLEAIDDEHARTAATLLRALRGHSERYAGAGVRQREQVLEESRRTLREALLAMGMLREGQAPNVVPYFEDAGAAARAVVGDEDFAAIGQALARFVALTRRLAFPRADHAGMRHFFDTFYQAEDAARGVPLLRFYEDYHREHYKAHLAREKAARGNRFEAIGDYDLTNPFGLDLVRRIEQARERVWTAIAECWEASPGAEEIALTSAELAAAVEAVEEGAPDPTSAGFFLDFVPARDGRPARGVIGRPGYAQGYGRLFSRFLYLLPGELGEAVMEANAARAGGVYAEICGDANFNANLHPPLLRREISYPAGESGLAGEQIASTELRVLANPVDPHSLVLRHAATGERVIPVDLGFLERSSRPPLYQLLNRFTPMVEFYLPMPDRLGRRRGLSRAAGPAPPPPPPAAPAVVYRPRVTFDGVLVLGRRQWRVPAALFPQRAQGEAAHDFFVRADRWRRAHGIPREVYVRIDRGIL